MLMQAKNQEAIKTLKILFNVINTNHEEPKGFIADLIEVTIKEVIYMTAAA